LRKRTHGWLWGLQLEAGEALYNCGDIREEKVHHHSDKGQVALDADHLERVRLMKLKVAAETNLSRTEKILLKSRTFEQTQLNFVVVVSIFYNPLW